MKRVLYIITVTKDDFTGITSTIKSTQNLRNSNDIYQIVIDGSSIELREAVKNLTTNQKNIKYFWQEPNGISKAFNLGINISDAEWLLFLNGGDEILEGIKHENILEILKASRASAIIFEIEIIQTGEIYKHPPMWALWPTISAWIPHQATFIRSNLFKEYGTFDESFNIAMDFEFWLRCFSNNVTVDTLSIPITKFDITGVSYTQHQTVGYEVSKIVKMYLWKMIKIWIKHGLVIYSHLRHYSKIAKKT